MKSYRALISRVFMAGALAAAFTAAPRAEAGPVNSWHQLTTGNGLGFQIFDTNQKKITQFLDHPYRYIGPKPDPKSDGWPRRNLAYDLYFGLKTPGGSGWLNDASAKIGAVEYLAETNIIHAPVTFGAVTADTYYFSPFDFDGNMLVALIKAPSASDAYLLMNFHMGGTAGAPDSEPPSNGESLSPIAAQQAISETGPGGGAMVYVPLSGVDHADCQNVYSKGQNGQDLGSNQSCSGNDVVPGFQKKLGSDGWWAVAVGFTENAGDAASLAQKIASWGAGRAPEKILADAQAEWDAWRKPALCSGQQQKLWRQSEAILRMGMVREPYTATRQNHGMLLASLPVGEWHSGWVRDGTFALVALARTGHLEEAKAGVNFYLDATKVGKYKSYVSNQDYRVSVVRYFGSGEEEADYSGQPTPNVEIDGWGLVLWAARQYLEASGDVAWLSSDTKRGDKVYQALVSGIAKPLEANVASNIVKADSGIWEVHDANKKHFAFTTLSAIRGFCDLAAIAKKAGNDADATHYRDLSKAMKQAFLASFVNQQGALCGSLEETGTPKCADGAVAAAFAWNLIDDPQGQTATETLKLLQTLKVSTGGYKRNNDGLSSYDNNEWILVDLLIANALRRAGNETEAESIIKTQVLDRAQVNYGLVAELYDAVGGTGSYTGSVPMVGYGAGAYIMTMLDRAGYAEPNDCGDGAGLTLPAGPCNTGTGSSSSGGGASTSSSSGSTAGGGSTPGLGGGGAGGSAPEPYGAGACLCRAGTGDERAPVGLLLLGALGALLSARRRAAGGRGRA